MGKKDLVTRIARWAMLLEEFDYEIIHRPGRNTTSTDSEKSSTRQWSSRENSPYSHPSVNKVDDPTKRYRHVDRLQRILNSTISHSTKWTSFELLTGIQMRNKEDLKIRDLLMQVLEEQYLDQRESMRQDAKRNILKIQAENKKTYNKKRKKAPEYQAGDLVAVQHTQFGGGLNLDPNFLDHIKLLKANLETDIQLRK
ncbi:transposon Tf2-6 polyprotein [Trichonephila clavipes]|nr:transposon Tf2-6 polyprotein [Trichonephila clavipes]